MTRARRTELPSGRLRLTLWPSRRSRAIFGTRLRRLAHDWRFTTAAVLILGLGIGANTATFSLINAVRFHHASLPEPDRLVDIYQRSANPGSQDGNSYPAYLDMSAYTDVFAGTMATSVPHGVTLQRDGALRAALIENATASYPSVMGVRPSLGRWFTADEDVRGVPVVAVIGHQTWEKKFGADPAVIGRTFKMDGVPVTIIGVGPAGHTGTLNIGIVTDSGCQSPRSARSGWPTVLVRRPNESIFLVKARLKPGVTVAQAQAAMDTLGRRLAAEYPQEDPGRGISVIASKDVWIHPQLDGPINATPRSCSPSSGSSSRSRAAISRRCCSCEVHRARRTFRSAWRSARHGLNSCGNC